MPSAIERVGRTAGSAGAVLPRLAEASADSDMTFCILDEEP
jgi:hypothetical protein